MSSVPGDSRGREAQLTRTAQARDAAGAMGARIRMAAFAARVQQQADAQALTELVRLDRQERRTRVVVHRQLGAQAPGDICEQELDTCDIPMNATIQDAVRQLRTQLEELSSEGGFFRLSYADLELNVTTEESSSSEGQLGMKWVIGIGGSAGTRDVQTHRVTLRLTLSDPSGTLGSDGSAGRS